MGEVSPNFKSALSFFNSLERSNHSPLIPRKSASNFEVNLKLIVDSKTVENITNYDVKKIIPRAKLTNKRTILCSSESSRNVYRRPVDERERDADLPPRKPKIKPKGHFADKLSNSFEIRTPDQPKPPDILETNGKPKANIVEEISNSFNARKSENNYHVPCDQVLTPDVEAKQIIEAFQKEITPYNTFEIPVNALDSDFFKQTLDLVPEIETTLSKRPRRKDSVYRLPKNLVKDKRYCNITFDSI